MDALNRLTGPIIQFGLGTTVFCVSWVIGLLMLRKRITKRQFKFAMATMFFGVILAAGIFFFWLHQHLAP